MKVAEKKFFVEKKGFQHEHETKLESKTSLLWKAHFLWFHFALIYLFTGQTTCKCFLLRTIKVLKKNKKNPNVLTGGSAQGTNGSQFLMYENCLVEFLWFQKHCQDFCDIKLEFFVHFGWKCTCSSHEQFTTSWGLSHLTFFQNDISCESHKNMKRQRLKFSKEMSHLMKKGNLLGKLRSLFHVWK